MDKRDWRQIPRRNVRTASREQMEKRDVAYGTAEILHVSNERIKQMKEERKK